MKRRAAWKQTKDDIINRLEKTIKELTETIKEIESKPLDSEEKNRELMEEHTKKELT